MTERGRRGVRGKLWQEEALEGQTRSGQKRRPGQEHEESDEEEMSEERSRKGCRKQMIQYEYDSYGAGHTL